MDDSEAMRQAIALAASVRCQTAPNPWVGCVIEALDGEFFVGATQPPGGQHAEAVALGAAGRKARGATLWCTLEPCSHHGRTPPCADAIIAAGIERVVVGVSDPDPLVAGEGIARLRDAGIDVILGVESSAITNQLAPYLKHRTTGRPWVILKLAASLDGRTAAPDGTSTWITGEPARIDAHRLRAESDAIVVGAATVRTDDPSLTVRHVEGRDPLRVVLGAAPADARIHPALELHGDLGGVLDELGARGVLQVMVEGGATVAGSFHRERLVDRYVLYLAPKFFGGDDGHPLFAGPGAPTMADVWEGRILDVRQLGTDLRVELAAVGAEAERCGAMAGSIAAVEGA